MRKLRLLCAGLAVAALFTSCKAVNDGISDIGGAVSEITGDISSGLENMESGVESFFDDDSSSWDTSDISETRSDIESDIRSDVSELYEESSNPASESAPASGASSDTSLSTGQSAVAYDLEKIDNTKRGWGQGKRFDELNRPVSSVEYQEKYGKYDAYFIGPNEKVIYLTFDNGYENGNTAKILDTLKEKNVKAVFFCTLSYIKSQPELIQRMIDEGHAIGNHSAKHPCFPEVSIQRCEEEIMTVHQYMLDNYNYTMTLFRAPAGEYSERTLAQAQMLGYKTLFWSFAYRDWDPDNQLGVETALPKITKALHPGAIYLLHAVSPDNAAILGDFIDNAEQQGFTFSLFS